MVNGVVARVRAGVLLDEHLERLGHLRGLFRRAPQTDKPGIEGSDVLSEDLVGIALGIRGDEHDLYPGAVRAELLDRGRQFGQRGRADIGTVRVAEEDHGYAAAEIRQASRLSVEVRQLKIAAEVSAGDVSGAECWSAGI